MKNIRLIDATHLDKRIYNDIPLSVFGSIKKMAAMREIVEEEPTVEAVPLSWWNELKDFLKSWKDDPWEKITTSVTAELVLNKMNFIEEKGTEKQCF